MNNFAKRIEGLSEEKRKLLEHFLRQDTVDSSAVVEPYVAPRNELEATLAAIWEQSLGVERVGIKDNFFQLGGDSILSISIIAKAEEAGIPLVTSQLFKHLTIAELAPVITASQAASTAVHGLQGSPATPIEPLSQGQEALLSYGQQRIWFLNQISRDNNVYNIGGSLRIRGQLDLNAIERSLETIMTRHDVLRTTYGEKDGAPFLELRDFRAPFQVVDLSLSPQEDQKCQARSINELAMKQQFNLQTGPLLNLTLLRWSQNRATAVLVMHHIVADAWSVAVFIRELTELYAAFVTHGNNPLEPLPIQYVDFASWQRRELGAQVSRSHLSYWTGHLEGVPTVLDLPTDFPRPPERTVSGRAEHFSFSADVSEKLSQLSRQEGVSLFTVLLSIYAVMLYRVSLQSDMVIGAPVANRNRKENHNLIGFLVNTLPLRFRFRESLTFREFLEMTGETVRGGLAHQEIPLETLVQELNPQRSLGYTPFFQVMFVLQNVPPGILQLPGVTVAPMPREPITAEFDLVLEMEQGEAGLRGFFQYSTDLFKPHRIRRMVHHFCNLVDDVVAAPQTELAQLNMLDSVERRQLLETLQGPAEPIQYPGLIHHPFEQQAEGHPDNTALVFCPSRNEKTDDLEFPEMKVSYGVLNERADELAGYLNYLGVGPDCRVGICAERSLEMAVAILAVLKAGGAYLPLDPTHPEERLLYMLEDATAQVLIVQEAYLPLLPKHNLQQVVLDKQGSGVFRTVGNLNPATPEADPQNLAYVMYTSGSTGKPKGVMVTHRAIGNRLKWAQQAFGFTGRTRFLHLASFSFDISLWEFLAPLGAGGTSFFIPPDRQGDSTYLMKLVQYAQITDIHFVPSLLQTLLGELEGDEFNSLQKVYCGGEALSNELYASYLKTLPVPLFHFYGPTEATINMTVWAGDELGPNQVALGKPITNTTGCILDIRGNLAPTGVEGELYIGGACVARGYEGKPGLTAARFVPNPFAKPGQEGDRLYRSGDRVRLLDDGNLKFLGRVDHQVKLRGFRIELGEIESVLRCHPSVEEAVALLQTREGMDPCLVAYVQISGANVENDPGTAETSLKESTRKTLNQQMRSLITAQLPGYMMPAVFCLLEKLPLNANGKLDRGNLPAIDWQSGGGKPTAPRNEIEREVADIWQEMLNLKSLGIHDNFFEIGGHSLLATKIISRMRKHFKVGLSLRDLFQEPTIAHLADKIKRQNLASQLALDGGEEGGMEITI